MTTLAQAELTDAQRAQHARAKAKRVLPYEIAEAVSTRLSDGIDFARFTDRKRWLKLIDEVMAIPEAEK